MLATQSLTPKQERFCYEYVKCGIATKAYRLAFDVAPTTPNDTTKVDASRLMDHPNIILTIEALRAPMRQATQLSLETIVEELHGVYASTDQDSVKVSALKEVAELLGYRVSKSLVVNVDGDRKAAMSARFELLTPDQQEECRQAIAVVKGYLG